MAMGKRQHRERQEDLWVAHTELATAPGHPFYERLNAVLEAEGFDSFVEGLCKKFYAARFGRPSLTPGIYFRSLLIGYFEGLGVERAIAWRLGSVQSFSHFLNSLRLRKVVGLKLICFRPPWGPEAKGQAMATTSARRFICR
jgi:transposase